MEEQRRLVLHFDVNETIVIEDIAGGDTCEDCLNKILAKNALVRRSPSSMLWWDGTEIIPHGPPFSAREGMMVTPPPLFPEWEWPLGCEPYYKVCKSKSKSFTTHDGKHVLFLARNQHTSFTVPTIPSGPLIPHCKLKNDRSYIQI